MPDYRLVVFRGRWNITFTEDGRRARYSLGVPGSAALKPDAEREARRFWIERHQGEALTVSDIWNLYGEDRAGRAILDRMEFSWKALAKRFGETAPERDLTKDSRAHTAERRKAGRADGTIWTELNHLRIVLTWAHARGLIAFKPYVELPPKPDPKNRHLTRAEAASLLAAPAAPHIALFIRLALTTAARTQALLDLTWDRVDFERETITLHDASDMTKRKGRATVPMNGTSRAALLAARKGAVSEYVIEWAGRKVGSIKRGVRATVAAAGLEGVSPHVFRHTAAVWMAEDGTPMEEIAQYLGHEDETTTKRIYARFSPTHLRRAASSLELETVPFGSSEPLNRNIRRT